MVAVFSHTQVGGLKVLKTDNGPHHPLVRATMVANRVVAISDGAPPGIREQAHAFRDRIRAEVAHGVREAIRDYLAHVATELEQQGMREAAALVREKEV